MSDDALQPSYPAGEYTIRIWGRTREIGVHKVTKEQYDYWTNEEWEDSLDDALNENFDYDEYDTPEECRFDSPYYEYQDTESFWGFDEDDTHMTIEDGDGNEIYSGSLDGFVHEAHNNGEDDSYWEASTEEKELYPDHMDEPGYYLMWTQGGKGSCLQATIVIEEGETFDPRKLTYTTWDVQGSGIVHTVSYDGGELSDEGMDNDNWRGQWSQFDLYETV